MAIHDPTFPASGFNLVYGGQQISVPNPRIVKNFRVEDDRDIRFASGNHPSYFNVLNNRFKASGYWIPI